MFLKRPSQDALKLIIMLYKTYAIYLGTDIIYSHLHEERLKSVLYSLVNELGEDLSDYIIVQNGTNHTQPADELDWDLSNTKPFDNISSLRNKVNDIANCNT